MSTHNSTEPVSLLFAGALVVQPGRHVQHLWYKIHPNYQRQMFATSSNWTLVLILEENAKSWRNLLRWMHNVSGSSVTWQGQSWQLMQTSSTDLAVLESIPQLLALLTAVHVVALELISREEVGEAVEERDIRSVEPAGDPVPHPTAPSLALPAHTAHRLRGGDGQGQVLDKLH